MLRPGGLGANAPTPALGINSCSRRRFAAPVRGSFVLAHADSVVQAPRP